MKDRTAAKERHWEDTFATFAGKVAWAAGHPIEQVYFALGQGEPR